MSRSINVRAFAASGPHRQCAAPCPEYKCSRSADAHSRLLFAARNANTIHIAEAAFPPMANAPMLFPGAPVAPAPIQSAAMPAVAGAPLLSLSTPYPSAYMAPPAWLMCICLVTCLGPR